MSRPSNKNQVLELTKDFYAIGVHGVTGQDVDEGHLEAGTLISDLVTYVDAEGTPSHFLASTDGGKTWYKQRSFGTPEVKPVGPFSIENKTEYDSLGNRSVKTVVVGATPEQLR